MKWFHWCLIFIFCSTCFFFIKKGSDNRIFMEERYKRALDAGCDAAVKYRSYVDDKYIESHGTGFGIGYDDKKNVAINRDDALEWFYRMFFRNASISDKSKQDVIKKYIPMKALLIYDRLMIADLNDNWIYDKPYIISYKGKNYNFTLSEQIFDIDNNVWINCRDIDLSEEVREILLNDYIKGELTSFINNRENKESNNYYNIKIALTSKDEKLSGVNGVNFIVFCEGLPLPSLNPFKNHRLYAFGVGGSEIYRE